MDERAQERKGDRDGCDVDGEAGNDRDDLDGPEGVEQVVVRLVGQKGQSGEIFVCKTSS